MKRHIAIILFLIVLIGLFFWMLKKRHISWQDNATNKLQVVASFYPLYFFATEIGGDKANVTNITPSGAEPHDFEPTPQDLVRMERSHLIILNGGDLEAWRDNLEKNIESQKTKIVVAGEGLTTRKISEVDEIGVDPHIWLDPVLAEKMVSAILQGFEQVDPENKSYYDANAQTLQKKLTALDAQYKNDLSSCVKRDIITAHAAFGYLADAYGLQQVSIAGLSPDAEPSPSQLVEITKFAKDNNVKYIFFESLASPKLAETIATEVGAHTLVLDPLEGLTPEEISQGKNYLTVMRDNLKNLKIALECQ